MFIFFQKEQLSANSFALHFIIKTNMMMVDCLHIDKLKKISWYILLLVQFWLTYCVVHKS